MYSRTFGPAAASTFLGALLLGLTGCGGDSSQGNTNTTTETVTATPTVPATTTETSTVTAPASPSATTPSETTPDSPSASTSALPIRFKMPNEVGRTLQEAQDDVQRVSGNPAFFTTSTDARGANRSQVIDSNWVVCSQSEEPGSSQNQESQISFDVVKIGEDCP